MALLRAQQHVELPLTIAAERALEFVRQPVSALRQVSFLRGLVVREGTVGGELFVRVPTLGEVDLPFLSRLEHTPQGARLHPVSLPHERAWVSVSGEAQVTPAAILFEFDFVAHFALPTGTDWGSAAFEKMAHAAAQRTLERVVRELPRGIKAALEQFESI